MRVLITADLHYDSDRSRPGAQALAEEVRRTGGDALVLVGDAASAEHQPLRECLGLFEGFPGRKYFVLGNHCLWCLPGEDSIDRYERIVPAIAAEMGFAVLDHAPARIDGVGLAGSIGWYDYSYRHEHLGIPLDFYRAKVAPGAAQRFPEHRHLVEKFRGQLADWHLNLTARWMDGVRVRMEMTDEEFLEYLLGKLRRQLDELGSDPAVDRVLAFVHHLPVRRLLPQDRPAPLAFAAAFLGSDRIGKVLMDCGKLTHVFCGHSHWPGRCKVGDVEVVNLGCTYTEKHLEILDV
ncbi:MAG: metallophosphoesterase family protein [Planctomycetota bacterium]|jgi:predicted phosphohydrolase